MKILYQKIIIMLTLNPWCKLAANMAIILILQSIFHLHIAYADDWVDSTDNMEGRWSKSEQIFLPNKVAADYDQKYAVTGITLEDLIKERDAQRKALATSQIAPLRQKMTHDQLIENLKMLEFKEKCKKYMEYYKSTKQQENICVLDLPWEEYRANINNQVLLANEYYNTVCHSLIEDITEQLDVETMSFDEKNQVIWRMLKNNEYYSGWHSHEGSTMDTTLNKNMLGYFGICAINANNAGDAAYTIYVTIATIFLIDNTYQNQEQILQIITDEDQFLHIFHQMESALIHHQQRTMS